MNAKQEALMDEYFRQIDPRYHKMFYELAEFSVSLGYGPVRTKTKDFAIDFRNNRIKKSIMKMEVKEQSHDGYRCGERSVPGLRLKYFAGRKGERV